MHTSPGLLIETVKPGDSASKTAKPGAVVAVHYVGTLLSNGQPFDSSRERGQPFSFELGAGQVIQGWDEGIAGMQVGEIRKLTIPPHLAYGDEGFEPVIPPNSTLVFVVELLSSR